MSIWTSSKLTPARAAAREKGPSVRGLAAGRPRAAHATALLLAAIVGAALPRSVPADEPAGFSDAELAAIARALDAVNLSVADLGWDKRPLDDPFRLAVVDRALDEPLSLAVLAQQARADFTGDPLRAAAAARRWLEPSAGELGEPSAADPMASLDGLPAGATPELRQLVAAALEARLRVRRATPEASRELLVRDAARLYLDESEEPWDSAAVREAAASIDMAEMIAAFSALASVAAAAQGWTPESVPAPGEWRVGGLRVVVGGPGDDVHDADIVLDPGGNDIYRGSRFVVDLAGDDVYHDCAAARFDASLVVDLAGSDAHLGGDVAAGGAVGGVALLLDVAGDDRYETAQLGQGSGVLGIGMLLDLAGNDSYRGARFVQGFGGVRGLGVLCDVDGHDTYWSGGVFSHAPLLPENLQSLSQGFGFGLRPDASGGVGILVDHAGNDSYHAEVYGQGAAYWFALGMLVDVAGHDKYGLFQYGQGAGIHLAAGVLLDVAGSDAYSCNNGVAQGSGHDWAVGLLWDQAGNDCYQGSGMSQGGANANGIGMLVDRAGNDSYSGWNERNQGDSFPARGSVGLGCLVDLAGRDRYTHGGSDGATWTRGHVGVGHDVPDPPPAPPAAGAAP